jgi:hypothetical protein
MSTRTKQYAKPHPAKSTKLVAFRLPADEARQIKTHCVSRDTTMQEYGRWALMQPITDGRSAARAEPGQYPATTRPEAAPSTTGEQP